ncbi:hypothetical protein [Pseudoxanthomonas sp. USHLN014]|uniref:hypothetical protein n=1 Tax=Pseudoxanthomonas sp. USHLN014 TaxID=3081297 RepID=UPI00301BC1AB
MNPAARAALRQLLVSDPQFTAAMLALNLGSGNKAVVPKVLDGNRRYDQVGNEHLPCWINDAGDMQGEDAGSAGGMAGVVIGSSQQDWAGDIELVLLWNQQDLAISVDQTDRVPAALVQLLLRNPSLGETCTMAYVAEFQTDRNLSHPKHGLYARLRINTTIERDA